jgi:hypothetical protein
MQNFIQDCDQNLGDSQMQNQIDIKSFLINGNFGLLKGLESREMILSFFGTPDIHTPSRKSYPEYLIYGDIEFRLRSNKLITIILDLGKEKIQFPDHIIFDNYHILNDCDFYYISDLLKENKVLWKKDSIMSDEDQENYISENGVHFLFNLLLDKKLSKVASEYK